MIERGVIVFDMDGVIFDTSEIASSDMKSKWPDITDEFIKELLKGNFHEGIGNITLKRAEETEEEAQARKAKYAENKANAQMFAGIKELLIKLSENNDLVMNTSAKDAYTVPLLENNHIKELFSFLATAEVDKSKVKKFFLIAERFGKKPEEMLFVTDTIGDLREAEQAGVPTIFVTWGVHNKLDHAGNTYKNLIGFADTPEELENYINQQ